ncbi:MAG TPA: tetratricopeptide repeat protein, partial [Pyrinomonadaceae bacterium]|nr:tetratricopeptide repeat protein [Pyrinomonadaceae bacterium]
MRGRLQKHRVTFAAAVCAALLAATVLPLSVASCRTQRTAADEPAAFERLRALTRGGATPPEQAVAQLASQYEGTRTGALALLLQARLRLGAGNFAGAAALLQSSDFKTQTSVADHALWLRADALEKLSRRAEARAALEELARDYPDSLRAREATLRAARLLAQDNQPSAVPLAVKKLADEDDADALLLSAK